QVATGNVFRTPVLTTNRVYYLESEAIVSGCASPSRDTVYVQVVPEAPAPQLTFQNYTVYTGDALSVNPGPLGMEFNFYADRNGGLLLGTGISYTLDSVTTDTV